MNTWKKIQNKLVDIMCEKSKYRYRDPLQYSCLEHPMDGGGWCPWGHKELDTTERLHLHFHLWRFKQNYSVFPINVGCLLKAFVRFNMEKHIHTFPYKKKKKKWRRTNLYPVPARGSHQFSFEKPTHDPVWFSWGHVVKG